MSELMNKNIVREPFWAMKVDEGLSTLASSHTGLKEQEVEARKNLFGLNRISQKKRFTRLKIIWRQLANPLIGTLIFAGVLTLFLKENIETIVIFGAVLVNVVLGFWQESKAESVLELLKSYVRTRVRVRRDGREAEIDSEELVPGDIIKIVQGDRIPADARLIFTNNFEVDEAILTGESLPIAKMTEMFPVATPMPNRQCMVFSGTLTTEGLADAVVTATGNFTELGRIAQLIATEDFETTPLQKAIVRFANQAGLVLAVLVVIMFALGVSIGHKPFDMFLIAVAVAVSAVPEGLPIAMTVILAVGVQRLAAQKGIVRRLVAAETLGSTSLILTDKTGTLTEAKMEITKVIPADLSDPKAVSHLAKNVLWNMDVVIDNPEELPHLWDIYGKPLHVSLVRGIGKLGIRMPEAMQEVEILGRLPFSSSYKFSAVAVRTGDRRRVVLMGAPDILLKLTDLSDEEVNRISLEIAERANKGEKVVGVASKLIYGDEYSMMFHDKSFSGFKFDGMIALRDPIRLHVREALEKITTAGVKVVMATGDHAGTAEAIGRELGMIDGKGAVLTGDDLNYLQKEELMVRAKDVTIYARLTPTQKLQLVKMYQSMGEVVAVTGDGVNDAPALQAADIGVALGSGSDVAKSAAEIIILDDDFKTIVTAIEEGRRILDNIRKVIVYLLSDAFNELLLIGGALLFGLALPLNALQILFVNFFSDSFPAIALAFEKGIDGLGPKPRALKYNLLDKKVRFLILVIGTLTSSLLFITYAVMLYAGISEEIARTFIFASFGTYTLLLAFSMRSLEKSIFQYNPVSNWYLTLGVGSGIGMTMLAVYLPFFQRIFHTVSLPMSYSGAILAMGLINVIIFEVGKALLRRKN